MEISHFTHNHLLTFRELSESRECYGCSDLISGPAFHCKECYNRFQFGLHKSCAELPREILHPLHLHPLTLFERHPTDMNFVCDGCRHIFRNCFTFTCTSCDFSLDINCASLMDDFFSKHDEKTFKEMERKATINHFSHSHILKQCYVAEKDRFSCSCCEDIIYGSAYCCFTCKFAIHECCMGIPQQIQLALHAQHLLLASTCTENIFRNCDLCGFVIEGLSYICSENCFFTLHVYCADPFLRALRHKCHRHNLWHIVPRSHWSPRCETCDAYCTGSFYYCNECNMSFHLECIPIPRVVKHKCHKSHPLTLTDSVVEDDSEEYYCDACETQRNPNYPVYYCEECTFIAHIECVISEDDSSLEMLSYMGVEQQNDTPEGSDRTQEQNHVAEDKVEKTHEESHGSQDERKSPEEEHELDTEAEEEDDVENCNLDELDKRIEYIKAKMEALDLKLKALQKKRAHMVML